MGVGQARNRTGRAASILCLYQQPSCTGSETPKLKGSETGKDKATNYRGPRNELSLFLYQVVWFTTVIVTSMMGDANRMKLPWATLNKQMRYLTNLLLPPTHKHCGLLPEAQR